jgi:tetratricopeptide (TPR) repeat protein
MFLIFCFFYNVAYAQDQIVSSEILGIRAEDEILLIEVAKKYPQLKFNQAHNPPRLLIEIPNTVYHRDFIYDENVKGKILLGLNFINNVEVKLLGDSEPNKTEIVLYLNPEVSLSPKIISTKDNVVRISLLKPEEKKDVLDRSSQEIYNKAVEEQSAGHLDSAISLYNEAISKNPNFYLARFNMAKAYIDKNNYNEAIKLLLELVKEMQKLPSGTVDKNTVLVVTNTLGTAYYQTGYYDDAKKQFLNVVKLDPDFYQAYYNIGLVDEKKKEIKLAKESFVKFVSLKSDLPEPYYHIGVLSLILDTKEDKEEARKAFEKVVELAPDTKVAELSKKELEKLEKKGFSFKRK